MEFDEALALVFGAIEAPEEYDEAIGVVRTTIAELQDTASTKNTNVNFEDKYNKLKKAYDARWMDEVKTPPVGNSNTEMLNNTNTEEQEIRIEDLEMLFDGSTQ